MRYLHTMVRVADPEAAIRFFTLLGLKETRRMENQAGRYTLIYLAADEDFRGDGEQGDAEVELTYNWPPEDGSASEKYTGGRNFGHLAYGVDDIYETCARLQAGGVTINRPRVTDTWRSSARRTGSRSNCCRRANTRLRPNPGPPCPTRANGDGEIVRTD